MDLLNYQQFTEMVIIKCCLGKASANSIFFLEAVYIGSVILENNLEICGKNILLITLWPNITFKKIIQMIKIISQNIHTIGYL